MVHIYSDRTRCIFSKFWCKVSYVQKDSLRLSLPFLNPGLFLFNLTNNFSKSKLVNKEDKLLFRWVYQSLAHHNINNILLIEMFKCLYISHVRNNVST